MPWSSAQHRLFEGIAHGSIRPRKGLTRAKAAHMAHEGVRGASQHKRKRHGKRGRR